MQKPHLSLLTLCIIVVGPVLFSCQPEKRSGNSTFCKNFQNYMRALTSDEFEGRAPTTPGGRKTVAFIEEEFRRIGLKPANGQSYLQTVPLVEVTAKNFSPLMLKSEGKQVSFSFPEDFVIGTSRLYENIELKDSELVFAGYGIVAPEYGWDDYKNIDVRGKTVLVLINDPGFELKDPDFFAGSAMTYYGRWTYKYEEAMRQGAEAVLIVHETEPASYGWDVVRNSWSGHQYKMGGSSRAETLLLEGWIHKNAAENLFNMAGFSFDDLKKMAIESEFEPFLLNLKASLSFDVSYQVSDCYNVAGYIEGSQFPDEYIIYLAHWDHLGMEKGPNGPIIYNGAIDNATGTAALMAIAGRFAAMNPAPKRSVVFVAVTAEESGLIGSTYYAQNPLFPLEKTVGGINIDGLNVFGPTNDVSVVGYKASQLQDYLQKFALEQNRELKSERHPERGSFFRSDHFPLVLKGVPMLYFGSGNDFVSKDEAYSKWVEEELKRIYHSPHDVIYDYWEWSGIDQDLWLFYKVGKELATTRTWPQWSENSEFRAIREASEHLRR